MSKTNNVTAEQIMICLEDLWGFGLPKSYRSFLLSGPQDHSGKIFMFKEETDNGSVLSDYFKFEKGYARNILQMQTFSGSRVPSNMFPIASDQCGNLILLSVKGPDRGKIYFWDHEMEADEGEVPDYSNLTLIADSFEEFIEGLKEPEELP